MISSPTVRGTCSYRSKCMEYVALPFVRDRKSVAYPNISANGTRALTICVPPFASIDRTRSKYLKGSQVQAVH